MNRSEKSFKQNLGQLQDLVAELPDSLSSLVSAKQKAKEVFRRIKLVCQHHKEEEALGQLGAEQIAELCGDLLRVYVLEPDLFSGRKIKLVSEVVDTFRGEKRSAEMISLIEKIESRLDLEDPDELEKLISQGCEQIFSDDFDLLFIRRHQRQQVDEALKLLEMGHPNDVWKSKLRDVVSDIDGELVECLEDRLMLKELLIKIGTEIESKSMTLKFDDKRQIVSFRDDYKMSPREFKLAKYLWQRHLEGAYWIFESEISGNKDLDITCVRDILRSAGGYRQSYKNLFDFKGSGVQKVWRIKF